MNNHEIEREAGNGNLLSGFVPVEGTLSQKFLEDRRVFLWGQVDDASARYVIERLLYLDGLDSEREITLVINSPGGLNTSGFAILDVIDGIRTPVSTLCLGLAASFGALILISGSKGRRFAAPRSRILLHQPWIPGKVEGPATDLQIQAIEIAKQRKMINNIIAERSGQEVTTIERETDRDRWFSAAEAQEFGLIDGICETVGMVVPRGALDVLNAKERGLRSIVNGQNLSLP